MNMLYKYCCKILQFQVSKGYSNWKDAITAFQSDEKSTCHREALEMIITLPATTTHIHVGVLLSKQHVIEMESNRRMLQNTLACINFLAEHGLPLCGHDHYSAFETSLIRRQRCRKQFKSDQAKGVVCSGRGIKVKLS